MVNGLEEAEAEILGLFTGGSNGYLYCLTREL